MSFWKWTPTAIPSKSHKTAAQRAALPRKIVIVIVNQHHAAQVVVLVIAAVQVAIADAVAQAAQVAHRAVRVLHRRLPQLRHRRLRLQLQQQQRQQLKPAATLKVINAGCCSRVRSSHF